MKARVLLTAVTLLFCTMQTEAQTGMGSNSNSRPRTTTSVRKALDVDDILNKVLGICPQGYERRSVSEACSFVSANTGWRYTPEGDGIHREAAGGLDLKLYGAPLVHINFYRSSDTWSSFVAEPYSFEGVLDYLNRLLDDLSSRGYKLTKYHYSDEGSRWLYTKGSRGNREIECWIYKSSEGQYRVTTLVYYN